MLQTNVFLLPDLIQNSDILSGSCCVVIDVLRATTTIINALGNQASSIIPVVSVEQARLTAQRADAMLGGERDCVKLEGFDFGNSPAEYTKERVKNQVIALTTTNGTRALLACVEAEQVLVAAFANLSAVRQKIANHRKVNIICAGTNGEITLEDTLLAGALAAGRTESVLNDQALLAINLWQPCEQSDNLEKAIYDKLLTSRGGKNLQRVGMVSDIRLCAQLDTHSTLPTFSHLSNSIQL